MLNELYTILNNIENEERNPRIYTTTLKKSSR